MSAHARSRRHPIRERSALRGASPGSWPSCPDDGESGGASWPRPRVAEVDDRRRSPGRGRSPSSATPSATRHVKGASLRSARSSVTPPVTAAEEACAEEVLSHAPHASARAPAPLRRGSALPPMAAGPVPYARRPDGTPRCGGDGPLLAWSHPYGTGAPVSLAELVVVANRLPVDRVPSPDDSGGDTWRRSPGGLVTALEPVMRQRRRRVGGLARPARRRGRAVRVRGHAPHSRRAERRRRRELLRGLLERHDLAAVPRRDRRSPATAASGGTRTSGSIAASREAAAAAAADGATVWVQDYQLQLVPQHAARAAPRPRRSATSTTFPSRHTGCTRSCRGGGRCSRGCSAPT